MYDAATVGSSRLQEEFVPKTRSVDRVLRSNRLPIDPLGYRDASYAGAESRAIVRAAFVEMLGRDPQEKEAEHWTKWLRETRSNADSLRRNLMATLEFVRLHGYVNPLNLHTWRNDRWLGMILETCSAFQAKGVDWPNARECNESLLKGLRN